MSYNFPKHNVLNAENFAVASTFLIFGGEGGRYIFCSGQHFKCNELVMFSLIAAEKHHSRF